MLQNRRKFLGLFSAGAFYYALPSSIFSETNKDFRFRYIAATNQFGKTPLGAILPVVKQLGTNTIDLWPEPWGNQREQVAEMGEDAFRALLEKHDAKLGCITAFRHNKFPLADEIRFLKRFGGDTVVIMSRGFDPNESKAKTVRAFLEKLKPEIELAGELGVRIAVENHLGQLTHSPEDLRRFIDAIDSPALGIALAPRHLPQDAAILSKLICYCDKKLFFFYAWQRTDGTSEMSVDDRERTQLPGRGTLDFKQIVDALREIRFEGFTEIFMHPVPRGRLIHDNVEQTVAELNLARNYLDALK